MKKIMLTCISALLITLGVQAQHHQDTTRTKTKTKQSTQYRKDQTTKQQGDKRQQDTDQAREPRTSQPRKNQTTTERNNRNTDQPPGDRTGQGEMVIIQPNEVPATLRSTLQDEKYRGWENAIIYHNTRTGEYLISPRPYRFNSEGKVMEYSGRDQYGQHKGTKDQYGNKSDRNQGTQKQGDMNKDEQSSSDNSKFDPDKQAAQDAQGRYGDENGQKPPTGSEQEAARDLPTDKNAEQPQQSERYRADETTKPSDPNREEISTEGMVMVDAADYPMSLRETLNGPQFKGWEQGKVYRDPYSGEYVLVMEATRPGTPQQKYRFDKNGKVVSRNNSSDQKDNDQ